MSNRPNPLLYGTNEEFYSTFKLTFTMKEEVDHEVLSRSVARAMERYPYFSVSPVKKGEDILLEQNSRPVPVFPDGRSVMLGTEESQGHLVAFGCEGRQIFLNASHYIADGMGIDSVWKTVLYLYISELYGSEGLEIEKIQMPEDPVAEEEYAYPFPEEPVEIDDLYLLGSAPDRAYGLDEEAFEGNSLYAYHLHIPQKVMMGKANPSDGSPVSYLSVMLYRALCQLDHEMEEPVVAHVQHQYRGTLKTPVNRHSLVNYIPVVLPARMKEWPVMDQNTAVRGQVLLASERARDLQAINRLVEAFPKGDDVSLAEKEQAMRQFIDDSICGKTFGISYVGKIDWCGLDQYVEDIHAYIGEKHTKNMLLIEVMTIGEDFTINFMQSGRGDRYVNAFMEQLRGQEIPVEIIGEEWYTLCDAKIPE